MEDDIVRLLKLFSSCCFVFASTTAVACPPYLITNTELTKILNSNIHNAPFSNASASTNKRSVSCSIELSVTINATNSTVHGCTSPVYQDYAIGLSDITLDGLGSIPISSGFSDISDKITEYCGSLTRIMSLQVDDAGVLVLF